MVLVKEGPLWRRPRAKKRTYVRLDPAHDPRPNICSVERSGAPDPSRSRTPTPTLRKPERSRARKSRARKKLKKFKKTLDKSGNLWYNKVKIKKRGRKNESCICCYYFGLVVFWFCWFVELQKRPHKLGNVGIFLLCSFSSHCRKVF